MKKIHVLGLALLAVFAFSAVATTSAFASQWLVNGEPVTAAEPVETSGELELIHLEGGFLEPEAIVLCSGIFDGTVEASGLDTISTLLTLGEAEVTPAKPLICKGTKTCEPTEDAEVTPENLPWGTQIELMGGTVYLDLFFATIKLSPAVPSEELPAYLIVCLVLGAAHTVLCFGETSAVLTNIAGGTVLGVFKPTELESEGLEGTCETKEKVALQSGEGVIKLAPTALGTTLEVSE